MNQDICIPDIGDAESVEVIEILVAVDQEVGPDDPILVIESDKASMEVPAGVSGRITALRVAIGDQVRTGQAIATVQLAGAAHPIEGALRRLGHHLLPKALGQHRHVRQLACTFGVEPIVQLAAPKGGLSMLLGPGLKRLEPSSEQGLAHQTSRPWPSCASTTNRAMKPSIAIRPFSRSVWVWKP